MNYFELFEIPVSFFPDREEIKKRYHQLSFKYHPDFHTIDSEYDESEILEKSAEINQAYQSLTDEDKCLAYILKMCDALPEEGKATVPQDFLMDMMDINEEVMDSQLDPDEEKLYSINTKIKNLESELFDEIYPVMQSFDFQIQNDSALKKITDFYLKKKYLLRLKQNLLNFAQP